MISLTNDAETFDYLAQVTEAQLEEALIQIDALKTQVEREVDSNTSQELYNHIATLESEMQNIQEQLESANTERYKVQRFLMFFCSSLLCACFLVSICQVSSFFHCLET